MSRRGLLERLTAAYANFSIQTVIVGALIGGLVISLGASTLIDWQVRRAALRASLEEDHRNLVAVLAHGLSTPIWNLDPEAGRPLLAAVMNDPRVVSIAVTTPLLADFLQMRAPAPDRGEILSLEVPVRRGAEEIGALRLEVSTHALERELAQDSGRAALVLAFQLIASTGVILLLLRQKVVKPLRGLVAQAQRIAGRELDHAIAWSRSDEVGLLGRSMEEMRSSLRQLIATLHERNQDLKQSEERFEAAARSLRDGLAIFDAEDRLVYYNATYPQHLAPNLRAVIALGKPFEAWIREGLASGPIYHPSMGEDFPQRRFAMRSQEFSDHEHQLVDGRWVRIREARMPDGGRVLLTADVTDQRQREQALIDSEERFRAIAEGVPVAVTIAERDPARIIFANTQARETFGALDDGDDGAIRRIWTDLAARRELLVRLDRGERVDGFEAELRRGDGTLFPALISARTLIYAGVPAVLFASSDLTPMKAAEAEIVRHREALHQNEKMAALGSLLAGVAHELNNPLSIVIGYACLLRDLAADDATRDRAERVHAAADRCARIVKTFLALARQKPQRKALVDVNALLADTVEMLGYQLQTSDVEVIRELDPQLPKPWGDSDQLAQVFINLIVNAQAALRAIPTPRRLWLRTVGEEDAVRVEVADNGPGVPDAVRARIFDPFFTTKEVGAGTGLGLSVSRGIVAAHDGSIAYRPRPGGGAMFIVHLPVATEVTASAEPVAAQGHARSGRARVLVVDDEPDIRALVADALAIDGHLVRGAASGRQAIAMIEREAFDLILSDLRMPDIDGEALYQHLKRGHPNLVARLAFLTGDLLSDSVAGLVAETGLPVLEKPLEPAALRGRVAMLLGTFQRQADEALSAPPALRSPPSSSIPAVTPPPE